MQQKERMKNDKKCCKKEKQKERKFESHSILNQNKSFINWNANERKKQIWWMNEKSMNERFEKKRKKTGKREGRMYEREIERIKRLKGQKNERCRENKSVKCLKE